MRYAARLKAVEINSSFYRPHRPATYARWAASVPDDFRFAVKMPKQITHERRLTDADDLLAAFLDQCGALGGKLGPLLVQLPPSLNFEKPVARSFFAALRSRFDGAIACEPRHESWFEAPAEKLLADFGIARVAADPIPAKIVQVDTAAEPGGYGGLAYYRLHGSPKIYYSNYEADFLGNLAARIAEDRKAGRETWCIFDNTALGHATANALDLAGRLCGS